MAQRWRSSSTHRKLSWVRLSRTTIGGRGEGGQGPAEGRGGGDRVCAGAHRVASGVPHRSPTPEAPLAPRTADPHRTVRGWSKTNCWLRQHFVGKFRLVKNENISEHEKA